MAKYKIAHVLVNYKDGTEMSYDSLDDRTWEVWYWLKSMDKPDVTSVVVTFVRRWQ